MCNKSLTLLHSFTARYCYSQERRSVSAFSNTARYPFLRAFLPFLGIAGIRKTNAVDYDDDDDDSTDGPHRSKDTYAQQATKDNGSDAKESFKGEILFKNTFHIYISLKELKTLPHICTFAEQPDRKKAKNYIDKRRRDRESSANRISSTGFLRVSTWTELRMPTDLVRTTVVYSGPTYFWP